MIQRVAALFLLFYKKILAILSRSCSGCPILPGYRTTRRTFVLWLSDSFRLSDNAKNIRALVVRFFPVIGQREEHSHAGCPILSGYRTTRRTFVLWLSDSFRLSDKAQNIRTLVVRFFPVIGQRAAHSQSGSPILPGYRTTYDFYPSFAKVQSALAA